MPRWHVSKSSRQSKHTHNDWRKTNTINGYYYYCVAPSQYMVICLLLQLSSRLQVSCQTFHSTHVPKAPASFGHHCWYPLLAWSPHSTHEPRCGWLPCVPNKRCRLQRAFLRRPQNFSKQGQGTPCGYISTLDVGYWISTIQIYTHYDGKVNKSNKCGLATKCAAF